MPLPWSEPVPPAVWLLRGFERYSRAYLARHFHAVRLLGIWPALPANRPVVIYLNHPSWWDPLICLLLAQHCCQGRVNYAPIDAAMLNRYGFLKRLGFFGVEQGSARGAVAFLQQSEAILRRPGTSLWLTPQGRFTDVRERPVRLARGLERLMESVPDATCLPLALEYTFWTERTPEALACFGEPALTAADLTLHLEQAQDRLAGAVQRREPAEFTSLLGGAAGEGGIYQTWRRWRAILRGEKFQRSHGSAEAE